MSAHVTTRPSRTIRRRARTAAVAVGVPLLVVGLSAAPALADARPRVTVLSSSLAFPLQLAVSGRSVYVADSGASALVRLGDQAPLVTGPQPGEVGGVSLGRDGRTIAYTTLDYATGAARFVIHPPRGADVVVDTRAFESTRNPDAGIEYGVANPSDCVRAALEADPQAPPATYTGQVDSHAYASVAVGNGWVVADAGGNDLLRVSADGRVSLLTVLPAQPFTFTADAAAALGLPDCVVGVTYRFEAVPTDVELGTDGMLYVTTLPGGPETPALGARGSLYRVDPRSGAYTRIAGGIIGATNVAVADDGAIYVTEFFAGRVSRIVRGAPRPYLSLPGAVAVEVQHGALYVATAPETDANGVPTGHGTVVQVTR
jgi:hypothetical protein